MSRKKIFIKNICDINRETISSLDIPSFINYLDTGNITKNKINEVKFLEYGKDTYPSRAQRKVKKNTIIYSTVRPNQEHHGFIEQPIKNLIVSTGFVTLDINDKNVDSKFLYYLLADKEVTNYLQMIAQNSVSSYPSINPQDIGNLSFLIPSKLNEQQKIAKVLSTLDAKIELNNRINKELEVMAKTLYDYWFVQFDFPNVDGKPYKSSGGKMVYNEELKREIPEGWKVDSLWNIANYFNGLPMQKHRPVNEHYLRVIKIKEMNEGYSDNTEFAKADIPKEAIIENGDILFSWSATLDVKMWANGKGALNQHIFKVTSDKYPKVFYFFELLNYLQHFKMMADLRKTTMGHITQEHLKQSKIAIPPMKLIEKIEKTINPILEKKLLLEQQSQNLTQLRDFLLPMLMNGQVSVKS
ncbi:MAG: restriction endonuclease subunit S [Sulfurimonas sp.]|nr:restriction endonuclease subunit S [Sulfurimonas sp.]